MAMDYNGSRLFAFTLAHRAVEDVKKGGFRQIRNYVDMCAILSNGHLQKAFFSRAQRVLEKTDNLYYGLVQRMIKTVDEDRICTVGVNLGLGGLIYGAGRLKQTAEETGENFSWITVANSDLPELAQRVAEAEKVGAYVWAVYGKDGLDEAAVTLAHKHPLSVFFWITEPQKIIDRELEKGMAQTKNIVPILVLEKPELTEAAHAAADTMRRDGQFFGFLVRLGDDAVEEALSAEWLAVLSQQALFCVYSRKKEMSAKASYELKKGIYQSRMASGVPLLLLDWENDTGMLNHSISPLAVTGNLVPQGEPNPLVGG